MHTHYIILSFNTEFVKIYIILCVHNIKLPIYYDDLIILQPSESGPSVIDVHVNKMYDAGSSILERDPGERRDILQRKGGPSKRIPCTALLVER